SGRASGARGPARAGPSPRGDRDRSTRCPTPRGLFVGNVRPRNRARSRTSAGLCRVSRGTAAAGRGGARRLECDPGERDAGSRCGRADRVAPPNKRRPSGGRSAVPRASGYDRCRGGRAPMIAKALERFLKWALWAWGDLSLDAKVVAGFGVANWLLLFANHTTVAATRDVPLWELFPPGADMVFLVACGALAFSYAVRDRRSGPRFTTRARVVHLAAIVTAFVIVPTIASIVLRETGKPYSYIHDGALMVEEAARKLLHGMNPYVADYLDTPMFYWPMINNPAFRCSSAGGARRRRLPSPPQERPNCMRSSFCHSSPSTSSPRGDRGPWVTSPAGCCRPGRRRSSCLRRSYRSW